MPYGSMSLYRGHVLKNIDEINVAEITGNKYNYPKGKIYQATNVFCKLLTKRRLISSCCYLFKHQILTNHIC